MAKNVPATTANSPAIHKGANRDNLPASDYTGTGFFPADTKDPIGKYTQPRVAPAAPTEFGTAPGKAPNRSRTDTVDVSVGNISKSAGDEKIKTDGIKMRGVGAAVKGVMSRGPMA